MRRAKAIETQTLNSSEMKRLRELEQENGLLKLLYADLLAKTAVLRDGLGRRARAC